MIRLRQRKISPIGVHWGPRMVRLVQLADEGGRMRIHALATADLRHEADSSPAEQDRETAAVLRQLLGSQPFRGRHCVSSLGAQELFVQNVRLPQLPPEEIDKVVRWEAEERLPYSACDAEIRHLMAGQVRQDSDVKQEVILLACHRGVVQRHLQVLESAGLMPTAIDAEPCAAIRALTAQGSSDGSGPRRAYLNLAEDATTVIFAEGQRILFLKYISGGGSQLDLAVARHLELGRDEAARMRALVTEASALDPEDEVHRSVIEAIRQPLDAMAAEIELCVRYYKVTFRGRPLESVVVTGSDASPWLAEYLGDRLGLPCDVGDPFAGMADAPPLQSRRGQWTTAIGLSRKGWNDTPA